jgi:hypothetical protein
MFLSYFVEVEKNLRLKKKNSKSSFGLKNSSFTQVFFVKVRLLC